MKRHFSTNVPAIASTKTFCGRLVARYDVTSNQHAVDCAACLRGVVATARAVAVENNVPLIAKQTAKPFKKLY